MGFTDNIRMMPPVTKNLLFINVLIYLAMAAFKPLEGFLTQYGALYYITSDQFIPTQLFSYMFIHASFLHLFFNMFALYMFGITMERVLGGPKFLFYYISCGLGAALVQEGVFHTPTIGASGAIFGILLAFGYMFPNVRLYLIFPPVPIKARIFVLIYAGVELLLGIYNSQSDTVAHFAHLGGMLFGLLILIYWRKKRVIGGPYF